MPRVAAPDRAAIVGVGRGEIVERVTSPRGAEGGHHILGHRAFVKARPPVAGDGAQSFGMGGAAEQIAHGRGLASGQVVPLAGALKAAGGFGPVEGDARRDRHAVLGIANRGGERVGQAEAPVVLRQAAERVDGTGDGHRLDVFGADGGLPAGAQRVGGQARGRAARSVQRDDLFGPGGFQQHEAVAADPAGLRLCQAQKDGACNSCVHRVAALLQDIDADLGSQRVRCRRHAVRCKDLGPSGTLEIAHHTLRCSR